jgi:hypothetical protein
MTEVKGIQETKELLKGIIDLAKVSAEVLRDGAQASDLVAGFTAIQGDPVKKAEVAAALAGIQEVPAEIKDISMAEGIELAILLIQELPGLLSAFKKPAV